MISKLIEYSIIAVVLFFAGWHIFGRLENIIVRFLGGTKWS